MKSPRLRTPLSRAFVPVLGGVGFFILFFAGLWLVALRINNRAEPGAVVSNKVFEVGPVVALAKAVATDGPLLFPDLKSPDGVRSLVLNHTGDDPSTKWQVFYGYPADRSATCLVTHVQGTATFTDCAGRKLDVNQLALPTDVRPIVENKKTLYLDLRGMTSSR